MSQDQKNDDPTLDEYMGGQGIYEEKLTNHIERSMVAHNRNLLESCPEAMWVACGIGVIHEILALVVHLCASTHEKFNGADSDCLTSTKMDSLAEPIHSRVQDALVDSFKFLPNINEANRYFLKRMTEITGAKTISSGGTSRGH